MSWAHLEERRGVHLKPVRSRLVDEEDSFRVVRRQLGIEQDISKAGGLRLWLTLVL